MPWRGGGDKDAKVTGSVRWTAVITGEIAARQPSDLWWQITMIEPVNMPASAIGHRAVYDELATGLEIS